MQISRCNVFGYASAALPAVLTLGLFYAFSLKIGRIPLDPDEGYYLALADRIAKGQVPFRDFFCHQIPLYSWVLSAISDRSESLELARYFSLGCWSLAGFLLIGSLRVFTAQSAVNLSALLLWHTSPLMPYAMQAVPVSFGMLLVATSVLLLSNNSRTMSTTILAGGLAVFAVAAKHVYGIAWLASLISLWLDRRERFAHSYLIGSMVALASLVVILFGLGGIAFMEVLQLQLSRFFGEYAGNTSGAAIGVPPADSRWIDPLVEWNISRMQVLVTGRYGFTFIVVFVLAVIALCIRRPHLTSRIAMALMTTVAGVIVFTFQSIPTFQHYLVIFLLSFVLVLTEMNVWAGKAMCALSALVLAMTGVHLATFELQKSDSYYLEAQLLDKQLPANAKLLSFMPIFDRMAHRNTACDMDDPANTYGGILGSPSHLGSANQHRFVITDARLISCLKDDSAIYVYRSTIFELLASKELKSYVESNPERIVQIKAPNK